MNKFKIIALFLVLVLSFTTFAGCQSTPTYAQTRWEMGEALVYNVNLVNTEKISYNNLEYTRDYDLVSEVSENPDQIKPVAVSGTVTVEISESTRQDAQFAITTTTNVVETYNKTDVTVELSAFAETLVSSDATQVQLRTSIESVVHFSENLSPVYSEKTAVAPYVGRTHQGAENYKVTATYNATTIETCLQNFATEQTTENVVEKASSTTYDSAQLFLILRALDQSSAGFESTVAVAVFDPITLTTFGINVTLARNVERMVFNQRESTEKLCTVNEMQASSGGFLTRIYNTNHETDSFVKQDTGSVVRRYTTVKIQQGYWTLELDLSSTTDAIINKVVSALQTVESN